VPEAICCCCYVGALGAVHFTVFSNQSVGYVLQSNSTVKYFKGSFQDPVNFFAVPMINAVGRAIAQLYANSSTSERTNMLLSENHMLLTGSSDRGDDAAVQWRPRLGKFPHPSLESGGMQLQGQILAVFIFASLMFGCVSQVGANRGFLLITRACARHPAAMHAAARADTGGFYFCQPHVRLRVTSEFA
jgi:hypothetical protein